MINPAPGTVCKSAPPVRVGSRNIALPAAAGSGAIV